MPLDATIPSPRRAPAAHRRNLLKGSVTAAVNGFETTLRQIGDLTARETIEDQDLAQKLALFSEWVQGRLRHIGGDLLPMLARAEWDRMNVGFFGETQHGKSTLIECLTRGNGASIGTGRKDHTREVTAASIRGMRVLDMPGIEGNEQTVLDQIKAGLHRSHVILFVLPCDHALDRLTLDKVRGHLRNEVVVFALINVFGSARDFADAPALREHKRATIAEIEKCFREQLGGAYQGSFVVAGRIAHATVARGEVPPNVQKDRAKAESTFGSRTAARRYSGLPELERGLRDQREKRFPHLPVLATRRIAGELDHILDEVREQIDGICAPIEQVIAEVRALPEQIDEDVSEAIETLHDRIGRVVDDHRNQAVEFVTRAIGAGRDKPEINAGVKSVIEGCSDAVKSESADLIQDLNKRINHRLRQMNRRIELLGHIADFSGDVDLSRVFERLRVTFRDVLTDIAETVLALAPALIGGIVGAVVVAIGLLKKVWDIFFGDPNRRKREAKEKAVEHLEKQFGRMKERCRRKSADGAESLRRAARKECSALTRAANRLEHFKRRLESAVTQLQSSKMQLATAIIHYLDPAVSHNAHAYLNTRGKRMIVVAERVNAAAIQCGLDGFNIVFCETRLGLRRATFADEQDPDTWRRLAREYLKVLKQEDAS